MKNVILSTLLFAAVAAQAQQSIQPIASGDYWQVDNKASRIPGFATRTTFPLLLNFTNGHISINSLSVNRLQYENEILWNVSNSDNVRDFVVEWSRDGRTFERAGTVNLKTFNSDRYVFRHLFNDNQLVYYRIGIITGANMIAYTPAVQVLDDEYTTKVFPTVVKGGTFYIQTAQAFEKLQVLNGASQSVYEKGINGQTGTITIGLPALQTGIYFVRLYSDTRPQHVQRILVD